MENQRGNRKRPTLIAVINLQVLPQPLVLLKEELQSEFQIEVNLGGEGDDVRRAQVPAADTHQYNDTARGAMWNIS